MVERDMVVDRLTIFETLHEGRRGNIVPVGFTILVARIEPCQYSQAVLTTEDTVGLLFTIT